VQLADFISYAVFRYYESNDSTFLDMIIHKFDRREKDHPPDGLKHFIKGNCDCKACLWRTQATIV